jgi:hypothetical protein
MWATVSMAADRQDEYLIRDKHVMTLREGRKQAPDSVRLYLAV